MEDPYEDTQKSFKIGPRSNYIFHQYLIVFDAVTKLKWWDQNYFNVTCSNKVNLKLHSLCNYASTQNPNSVIKLESKCLSNIKTITTAFAIYLVPFRLKCALSLVKSKSCGWVQIKCYQAGNRLTLLSRVTFESRKIILFMRVGKLFCLCYITKHLMTAPSGNLCFVSLESWCFPRLRSRGNIEILGKQNRCFPREQSLSILLYSINKLNYNY